MKLYRDEGDETVLFVAAAAVLLLIGYTCSSVVGCYDDYDHGFMR